MGYMAQDSSFDGGRFPVSMYDCGIRRVVGAELAPYSDSHRPGRGEGGWTSAILARARPRADGICRGPTWARFRCRVRERGEARDAARNVGVALLALGEQMM